MTSVTSLFLDNTDIFKLIFFYTWHVIKSMFYLKKIRKNLCITQFFVIIVIMSDKALIKFEKIIAGFDRALKLAAFAK